MLRADSRDEMNGSTASTVLRICFPFPGQPQRCYDSRSQFDTHYCRRCNKWLTKGATSPPSSGSYMNNAGTWSVDVSSWRIGVVHERR
jgi:hypothetical protein